MTLSRRALLKLGLQASAVPLLNAIPLDAAAAQGGEENPPEGPALRVRPLALERVRLLGGPLKRAQDADIAYLLELEPDRMLAYYRMRAGLAPKAAPYAGWDGDGRNLTGHLAGHYLSAVSLMHAATGDARFARRAHYIVDELKTVQDRHGDGYLSALAGGRRCFDALARGEIRSAAFDLNGEWSPWYTLHKTFAGLRDAYRYTGDRTALAVETRFARWAHGVLSGLGPEQIQQMLGTEFGGMNEVLVDLYADTRDERWLALSYAFEHRAFVEPLQRHEDDIGDTHANTQIPKLIGSAHRYLHAGRPEDLLASSFFWDQVVQHHSFATGGHGTDEYFGPPDRIGSRVDGRTAESCNVYNMLKLGRLLFAFVPDVHYADFHERMLFNHALGSFDPDDRRMCYMVPVGRGVTREYQDMFRSFTCCMGTGMENHALHGEGVYYVSGDRLWINQYVPSTAAWTEVGVELSMATDFPEGESATIRLRLRAPRELTLAIRRPSWVGDGFAVMVNGQAVASPATATDRGTGGTPANRSQYGRQAPVGDYVELKRTWRSGDVVEVSLPKTLRLEPTPDDVQRVAIMWGPLVLAGDLGPEPPSSPSSDDDDGGDPSLVPVLVAAGKPVSEWLQPVPAAPGRFRTVGVGREPNAGGRPRDVDLAPFYRLHHRTYAAYWDLLTAAEWEQRKAEYARDAERQHRLGAATVGLVQPGVTASERAFAYQAGPGAAPQRQMGRSGRASRSWFSYQLPVDSTHPTALVVTYFSADRRTTPASFDILIEGQRIAGQQVERSDPARFYDLSYPVPPELVRGKTTVTVRFQAVKGSQTAAIFGVRTVRADQLP